MHHFNGFAVLILLFIVWLITRPDSSDRYKNSPDPDAYERGFQAGARWREYQ